MTFEAKFKNVVRAVEFDKRLHSFGSAALDARGAVTVLTLEGVVIAGHHETIARLD